MAMTAALGGLDTAEQDATADLLASTGDLIDAILVVEYRLAVVAALAERFGTRYSRRATIELQAAVDALAGADARRRATVAAMTAQLGHPSAVTLEELVAIAPEPLRSALSDARTRVVTAASASMCCVARPTTCSGVGLPSSSRRSPHPEDCRWPPTGAITARVHAS